MGNQLIPGSTFVPGTRPLHCVVLGLDSAGKTALLYRLKLHEFVNTTPTKGFNMERLQLSGWPYEVWDVGGQEKLRPLWRTYTRRTDGLVFVVDAADPERIEEARLELHRTLLLQENQGVPLLVLANKQDLPGAMAAIQVDKALSLRELNASTLHHTQGCSAVDGGGLQLGLEILHRMILRTRRSPSHSGAR